MCAASAAGCVHRCLDCRDETRRRASPARQRINSSNTGAAPRPAPEVASTAALTRATAWPMPSAGRNPPLRSAVATRRQRDTGHRVRNPADIVQFGLSDGTVIGLSTRRGDAIMREKRGLGVFSNNCTTRLYRRLLSRMRRYVPLSTTRKKARSLQASRYRPYHSVRIQGWCVPGHSRWHSQETLRPWLVDPSRFATFRPKPRLRCSRIWSFRCRTRRRSGSTWMSDHPTVRWSERSTISPGLTRSSLQS
jgi:hypothetical protein